MEGKRKVIKIEDNIVFIEFDDKTIGKYLITNFISNPYIGELVEFTKDGLIYESKNSINEENIVENKRAVRILEIIAWILFLIYIIFLIYSTLNDLNYNYLFYNIGSLKNQSNYLLDIFLFIYLLIIGIFFNNTKNTLMKILFFIGTGILILLLILVYLYYLFIYIACMVCLI